MASSNVEVFSGPEDATSDLSREGAHPSESRLAESQTRLRALTGALDRRTAVRAALKAGILGFFIGNFIPFVAIVLAGALAVFFYRRESGSVPPALLSSRIGSAAGVVAVAMQSLFFTIWIFVFHHQKEYVDSVTRVVHFMGAESSIPDIQASLRSLFTPAGLVFTLLFAMIVAFVLGSIGGALASLFPGPGKPRA